MAEAIATISARLRTEYPMPQYDTAVTINPDGKVTETRVAKTQAQYDQWILDQANYIRDQQLAAEDEVTRRANLQAQIDRLNPILTKLQNNVNLTGAENKTLLQDVLIYLLPKMIADAQAQL